MDYNIKLTLIAIFTAINAFIVNKLGAFTPLLYLVITLMISDLVTRVYAAGIRADEKIQSEKIIKGLYKKIGLFLLIIFSILLDRGLVLLSTTLGINTGIKIMITALTLAWLFIKESISNLENLEHAGIDLPPFITKSLNLAIEKVEQLSENIIDRGDK